MKKIKFILIVLLLAGFGACNYLDVSPVFADAIQRIYEENSMSVLF